MNRLIAALALALFVVAPARAASTYAVTSDASSTTLKLNGRLHMQSLAGVEQLVVDSVRGLFTWTYGIQASTANFTGTGNATYSVTTSSGISVAAGGVTAPWFSASTGFFGSLFGNATTSTLATSATNLAGGAAGSQPYQTGSGATAFVVAAAGKALSIVGTTPTWLSFLPTTVSISTVNVSPGFNAASNFVQLTAAGLYPALNGSLITNLSGTISGLTPGLVVTGTGSTTIASGSVYDNGAGAVTAPAASSTTYVAGSTLAVNGSLFTLNGALYDMILSVDGATQAPGCLVVISDNGSQSTITSTTTSQAIGIVGVLAQTCVPNTLCSVQTRGRAVITETGASSLGNSVITTTTRCQGSQAGAYASNSSLARIQQNTGGAGSVAIWMH